MVGWVEETKLARMAVVPSRERGLSGCLTYYFYKIPTWSRSNENIKEERKEGDTSISPCGFDGGGDARLFILILC